ELHDQIVRLDRYLGTFLDSLYRVCDSTRVIIALTADHGVAPFPESHNEADLAERMPVLYKPLTDAVHAELARRGVSDSTTFRFTDGMLLVNREVIAASGTKVDSLVDAFAVQ